MGFDLKSKRNKWQELTVAERLWSHVDSSNGPDACWNWVMSTDKDGYGTIQANHRKERAHKVAYEVSVGSTNGLSVLHTCDNPKCCNPKHLFLGTTTENMKDKTDKRRQAKRSLHGMAILTEDKVAEIRQDLLDGMLGRDIAIKHKISASLVSAIKTGRLWKESK